MKNTKKNGASVELASKDGAQAQERKSASKKNGQFFIDLLSVIFSIVNGAIDIAKSVICNNTIAIRTNASIRFVDYTEYKCACAKTNKAIAQAQKKLAQAQKRLETSASEKMQELAQEQAQRAQVLLAQAQERKTKLEKIVASRYNVLCYIASYIVRKFILARTACAYTEYDNTKNEYVVKKRGFLPIQYYIASRQQFEFLLTKSEKSIEDEFILDLQAQAIELLYVECIVNKNIDGAIDIVYKTLRVDRDAWRSMRNKTIPVETINDIDFCRDVITLLNYKSQKNVTIYSYSDKKLAQELLKLFYRAQKNSKLDFFVYYPVMRNIETKTIAGKLNLTSSNISQKKSKILFYLYNEYFSNPDEYKTIASYNIVDCTYTPPAWILKKLKVPAWIERNKLIAQAQEKQAQEKQHREFAIDCLQEKERRERVQAIERAHINDNKLTVEQARGLAIERAQAQERKRIEEQEQERKSIQERIERIRAQEQERREQERIDAQERKRIQERIHTIEQEQAQERIQAQALKELERNIDCFDIAYIAQLKLFKFITGAQAQERKSAGIEGQEQDIIDCFMTTQEKRVRLLEFNPYLRKTKNMVDYTIVDSRNRY